MKFDGTITVGDILMILSFAVAFLAFYGRINKLFTIIQEYPPHKHVGNEIVYPHGMSPDA